MVLEVLFTSMQTSEIREVITYTSANLLGHYYCFHFIFNLAINSCAQICEILNILCSDTTDIVQTLRNVLERFKNVLTWFHFEWRNGRTLAYSMHFPSKLSRVRFPVFLSSLVHSPYMRVK